MYGAGWVLEISGGTLRKVYDYLTSLLYTWNQYKIITNVKLKKIKVNKLDEHKKSPPSHPTPKEFSIITLHYFIFFTAVSFLFYFTLRF